MFNSSDPLDTNFPEYYQKFSQVGIYTYNPIPNPKSVEITKCVLCGQEFGFSKHPIRCHSCRLKYCQRCVQESLHQKSPYPVCDICFSLQSDNSRVIDYQGLTEWATKHMKADVKKLWSLQCAVQFIFSILTNSKHKDFHYHFSILINKYADVICNYQVNQNFIEKIKNHYLTCKCNSLPVLLDAFVTIIQLQKLDEQMEFDNLQILTLVSNSNLYIKRAGCRVALALTEQGKFNPDQQTFLNVLAENDRLIYSYVLSALTFSTAIPQHYDIPRDDLSTDEETCVYKNNSLIVKHCMMVFAYDSLATFSNKYYASIILYNISQTKKGSELILSYRMNKIVDAIHEFYPPSPDKIQGTIPCFLAQVVIDTWKVAALSKKHEKIHGTLFPMYFTTIADVLDTYVPYDVLLPITTLRTLFLNLCVEMRKDPIFGQALLSQQMTQIINSLQEERVVTLGRQNSALRLMPRSSSSRLFKISKNIQNNEQGTTSLISSPDDLIAKKKEILEKNTNHISMVQQEIETIIPKIESIKEEISKSNNKANEREEQLLSEESKLDQIEKEIDTLEDQLQKEEAELEQEKEKYDTKKSTLNAAKKKQKELQTKKNEIKEESENAENDIKVADIHIQNIKNKIEYLQKSQALTSDEVDEKIRQKQKEKAEILEELENLRNEQNGRKENMEKMKSTIKELDEEYSKLDEENEKLKETSDNVRHELIKLQKRIEIYTEEKQRVLSIISEKKENLESMQSQLQTDNSILDDLNEQISNVENQKKENDEQFQSEISYMDERTQKIKEDYAKKQEETEKRFKESLVRRINDWLSVAVQLQNLHSNDKPIEEFFV